MRQRLHLGVTVELRLLDRKTRLLAQTQLGLVLERTTDMAMRRDLTEAIEDLIWQDAAQVLRETCRRC